MSLRVKVIIGLIGSLLIVFSIFFGFHRPEIKPKGILSEKEEIAKDVKQLVEVKDTISNNSYVSRSTLVATSSAKGETQCSDSDVYLLKNDNENSRIVLAVCNKGVFQDTTKIVEKWNAPTSAVFYGLVKDYSYKCACHDEIGYFSFNNVKEERGGSYIASPSIISYKTIGDDIGHIYTFNGFPYLVSLGKNNLYLIDLDTKKIIMTHTLEAGEDFNGPDLPDPDIKMIDSKTLNVKIYHNRDETQPWLYEYRKVTIPSSP